MPELQSCYFCGTADEVTEYAVIPPRFADDEADQRSAVLCEQCKDKLMRVVEPLAEKLDASGVEGPATTSTASTTGPDSTAKGSDSESRPTEPDDGGIVMDATSGSTRMDDEATSDATASNDPADVHPELDAESPAGEAAREDTAGEDPPPNYRQAMRLLSNREFPMERHDVEGLLAGAYELENEEVAAILAYATEAGRLEDDDGTLRRA